MCRRPAPIARALLAATGGALALVSGRPIADLDQLFAPLKLPAVGGHGAEMRLARRQAVERVPRRCRETLRQQLAEAATPIPAS